MAAVTPLSSNKGLMGAGLHSAVVPYFLALHLFGLGLVGWSIVEQRQMQAQVLDLQASLDLHQTLQDQVSTVPDPPTPPPVGNPSNPPLVSEDGLRAPGWGKFWSATSSACSGLFTMCLILLALVLIGLFCRQRQQITEALEDPGTPDRV